MLQRFYSRRNTWVSRGQQKIVSSLEAHKAHRWLLEQLLPSLGVPRIHITRPSFVFEQFLLMATDLAR